ncbi:MAG: hypothetical protein H7A37_09215 [Chlamydiales bacterium]|nr:hypothetical protein [Chlamydiia bacterium]MCP5508456.1 hypothetical protein [Chlamydiales bacterium]
MNEEHELFYGYEIVRDQEQLIIVDLMKKYSNEPVTEELKRRIWDELQELKRIGRINIPFKVEIRRDRSNKYPPSIEVILDTKV